MSIQLLKQLSILSTTHLSGPFDKCQCIIQEIVYCLLHCMSYSSNINMNKIDYCHMCRPYYYYIRSLYVVRIKINPCHTFTNLSFKEAEKANTVGYYTHGKFDITRK